jgi:tetratricopeptide (TPR) repeat protein
MLKILRLAGLQITGARRRGDYAGAATMLREALDVRLKGYPEEHPFARIGNLTLAKDKGEIEKARTILLLLLDEIPRLGPKESPYELGLIKWELIEILAWRGDSEEALKIAGPILDEVRRLLSEKDHDYSTIRDMHARILATAPLDRPGLRDVPRALELARANVAAFPKDGQFVTTLGIAHYQAGHHDDALAALAEGARLDKDFRVAPRGFYVAMARWGKGDKDKARAAFDGAAAWMDKNRPGHPELTRPRAEAAGLLGIKDVGPAK